MWKRRGMLSASVLLAVLLLALPVVAQHHPYQQNPEDLKIQQLVNDELAKHSALKDVHATVDDRIVTLQGPVDCYYDKVSAEKSIHKKPGVEGVRNQIVVGGKPISDDVLRDKIAKQLAYDRINRGNTFNNFTLGVKNRVVTLGGQARTPADLDSALAIIRDTCQVQDIVNNVQVLPTSLGDDRIRERVARAVYGDPVLQKYAINPMQPIRIVVENGHVTLYGVVDNANDRQIAEFRAREVPGTFSVTNKLEVAGKEPR